MTELVEKAVDHGGDRVIVELIETASGQDDDIDCSKVARAHAEGLTAQALDAIARHGAADILARDDQAKSGYSKFVGLREHQQLRSRNPESGLTENLAEIP
jgi:hypothetical protein